MFCINHLHLKSFTHYLVNLSQFLPHFPILLKYLWNVIKLKTTWKKEPASHFLLDCSLSVLIQCNIFFIFIFDFDQNKLLSTVVLYLLFLPFFKTYKQFNLAFYFYTFPTSVYLIIYLFRLLYNFIKSKFLLILFQYQ